MSNDDFLALLPNQQGDERIPWKSEPNVTGFSILREYPVSCRFKPAYTAQGKPDHAVLVKVGFLHREINSEQKVSLLVSVSKASKYILNDGFFRYNYDDPSSPSEEALKKSANSSQPIDLTENGRFIFDLSSSEFFDTKKKKKVPVSEIINHVYRLHVDTANLKGFLLLKSQIRIRDFVVFILTKIILLLWDSLHVVGKKIEKKISNIPVERKTFHVFFTQTKFTSSDLISIPDDQKISLSGSDYKISIKATVILASIVLIFFLYNYFFPSSFASSFPLFIRYKDEQLFLGSFLIVCYFIIDSLLPRIAIFFINKLVTVKSRLMNVKFPFS